MGSPSLAVGEHWGDRALADRASPFPHSPTPDPRRSVEGLPAVLLRPAPWACGRGLRARERGWGRRAVRSKATTTSSSSCWWATAMWARARSWKACRTARPNPRTPTATVRRPRRWPVLGEPLLVLSREGLGVFGRARPAGPSAAWRRHEHHAVPAAVSWPGRRTGSATSCHVGSVMRTAPASHLPYPVRLQLGARDQRLAFLHLFTVGKA